MIPTESPHSPGTIGIISGELSRYSAFAGSLITLRVPNGSVLSWACGVGIAENLNSIVEEMKGDWLWILGDDHTFAPEILLRLLDRDVPVVAPLVSTRKPPYMPVLYSEEKNGKYLSIPWKNLPTGGLFPVYAVGSAGMLIRRPVLDALGSPWFEMGKTASPGLGEDLYFCHKAQMKGFPVFADLDLSMGHITTLTITRERKEEWGIDLDLGNDSHMRLV